MDITVDYCRPQRTRLRYEVRKRTSKIRPSARPNPAPNPAFVNFVPVYGPEVHKRSGQANVPENVDVPFDVVATTVY
jgi:hypothetical protein